jgi:PAS domain S-box-containing protein
MDVQAQLNDAVPVDSVLAPGELHHRLLERISPPSILVNSVHEIVHLSESAGRFLQFAGGEPTRNLLRSVHPMLRVELRAALDAAAQTHDVATAFGVAVETGNARSLVDIRVSPAGDLAPNFSLVVFEEYPTDETVAVATPGNANADQAVLPLERELVATNSHLRNTIEESEASTEELKASNEELQAMNEELKGTVDQLARSNNDLQVLMAATDIATVVLDRELRIQRFTPSARTLFNFISSDLGRPLSDLSRKLDYPQIVADAEDSLAHLQPAPREVSAGAQWYLARALPYRTVDDHIAGVVFTFLNITEQKRAEQQIARLAADSDRQRRLYETVLTNTPDFVYVFSLDHRVLYANDALVRMWGCGPDGAIGKTFLEIGYEPWHAGMHEREIDEVRKTRQPVRGEVPFNGTNGRRQYDYIFFPVIGADGEVEAVGGTTRDVTERKEAEERLRTSEERQKFLIRLTDALRPLSDPIAVQAEASRVLGEHLGANRVVYFEIRDDEYVIERDHTAGVRPLAGRYPVASFGPALLALLLDGRTVVEADATIEPSRSPDAQAAYAAIQVRGHVDVPLVKGGKFVAGMTVHVSDRRDWTRQEVALIEDTAERTWAAVERARAEAALRTSEEGRRLALEAADLGSFNIDPTTDTLRADERFRTILTGTTKAIDYEHAFAAIHPGDRERIREAVAAATRADDPIAYAQEYRVVHPDGSVRWVYAKGRAHYDRRGTGQLISFDGTIADVTALKETEASLQQSNERLAFVRRSSGIGFWYCDLPFDVLEWDDMVKAHFHLPPDATVTIQTFYDRIHADDREPTREAIEQSISHGGSYNTEYRTVNPANGEVKWLRAIGRTFYAADGTPTRFDGVTLDVSEQKSAEARLKESEHRFRLMADAAPVMIWMSDVDKLVSWYNKPWLAFTGRSMEEEIGKGATEVVHPEDFSHTYAIYKRAFEDHLPFSMEYRLRRHDGEFRWMVCNGVPRYGSDGSFSGYIGSCLDVTDYKIAQAALLDADRRKDEFLATLAHELRNPLAPIRNGLQVIRMAGAKGSVEQVRSMMERQLLQMTRLVDDLLDVSRVTTGKLELRRERLELRSVITAAVETSLPVIEQHGHSLAVVVPDEPVFVDGDPIRLPQVISNLLTNSAKYTHRGGHIRVSVARDDAVAVVTVADDGIGIPTGMLQTVFGMFTQVDRALEKTTGGLGIGLSLAKGLVEMHGGTIEAFSEGEGRGSEFAVRLPVSTSSVSKSEPGEGEAHRGLPDRPHRILIIDDNVDAANSLGELLEMMGHEILTAYDGEAGIEAALRFEPSVVLCDIGMPKVNGYETARRIRMEEGVNKTVLIALTGWGQEDDLRKSVEAGFDHHLIKPVETAALTTLLVSLQTL